MRRKYELTVIYKENDPDKKDGIDLVENTLSSHGVNVLKKEEIGVRNLAYEINKCVRGFYCFYLIDAEADEINKISAKLRLSHFILRFLFVAKIELTSNQIARKDKKWQKVKEHLAKKSARNASSSPSVVSTASELEDKE